MLHVSDNMLEKHCKTLTSGRSCLTVGAQLLHMVSPIGDSMAESPGSTLVEKVDWSIPTHVTHVLC